MTSQTVDKAAPRVRTRAKLPKFVVPDLKGIQAAKFAETTAALDGIADPDMRLDEIKVRLDKVQKRLARARATRDALTQSLYYFEAARGADFEAAAGLSHVQMDRVKRRALEGVGSPVRTGSQIADREANRALAVANGLVHDPDAATKLPKTASLIAELVGRERALMAQRDAYVEVALANGVTQVAIAERIGRIATQVTRMARRQREAARS